MVGEGGTTNERIINMNTETNNAERLSYGADLIKAERLRQIHVEGRTSEEDDGHVQRELVCAAQAYIQSAVLLGHSKKNVREYIEDHYWPVKWGVEWFKPKDPIRDLTRAGALIAAEIDRLKRLEQANA